MATFTSKNRDFRPSEILIFAPNPNKWAASKKCGFRAKIGISDYSEIPIFCPLKPPMGAHGEIHKKALKMREIPIFARNPNKCAKSRYLVKPHGKGPEKAIG